MDTNSLLDCGFVKLVFVAIFGGFLGFKLGENHHFGFIEQEPLLPNQKTDSAQFHQKFLGRSVKKIEGTQPAQKQQSTICKRLHCHNTCRLANKRNMACTHHRQEGSMTCDGQTSQIYLGGGILRLHSCARLFVGVSGAAFRILSPMKSAGKNHLRLVMVSFVSLLSGSRRLFDARGSATPQHRQHNT